MISSASQIFLCLVFLDPYFCALESCCIAEVACASITLFSWLMLGMWPQPAFDATVSCFLFIILSMFCICLSVFMVRCWQLKKSGLNYQKDLSGAALPTSPCKRRDRGQTSVSLSTQVKLTHLVFWGRCLNSCRESPSCLAGINGELPCAE